MENMMLITQSSRFFPKNEYEYLVYYFPKKDFPCQDCSVFGINRLEYGHRLPRQVNFRKRFWKSSGLQIRECHFCGSSQ